MRLVVESIEAEDFLSYHEPQKITLGGQGPLAVVGGNGAGKSTLVSKALSWALYGTCAPERMGASTRALKGRHVIRQKLDPEHADTPDPERARVTVTLSDEDGTNYVVHRERTETKSDTVRVRVVNDVHGYDEIEGTDQDYVDRLIGADYDVFVRTCLRGQNDPWNFAEATDAKKREILDSISGAEQLNEAYSAAKSHKKDAETEAQIYATRAADAQRMLDRIDLTRLQEQVDQWAETHAGKVTDAEAEIEVLEERLEEAKEADGKREQVRQRRQEILNDEPELDLDPYYQACREASAKVGSTQAALHVAREGKKQAEDLISKGQCPECGQPIAKGSVAYQAAGVEITEEPLKAAEADAQECQDALAGAKQWLADARKEWQERLDSYPEPKQSQVPAVTAAIKAARTRLRDLEDAENPYLNTIEEARKQAYDLRREIAVFRDREREEKWKARMAGTWSEILHPKGVRAHMAESALAAIESEANRWLSVLSNGRFAISFPPTSKTKRTGRVREHIKTVVTSGGEELPLLAFSGGEKRRINLAVDLGVAATFARGGALALSLLVLDEEVFSGLDEEGKAGVVTALHHAGVADVVVIDHDPRLHGVFDRTAYVERGPDGYSRVTEETK